MSQDEIGVKFCPVCRSESKKSRVFSSGSSMTLVYNPSYYDEDGKYHHHDTNRHVYGYCCSNGHSWQERQCGSPCPNCDYGKDFKDEIQILTDEDGKPRVANQEGISIHLS